MRLTLARERIEAYHRRQKPADERFVDALGVELGHRWTAIEAVGLYVPGGTAAYPSSVLMNAVPAKVAGVPRVVMAVPAPDGLLSPLVLAAAKLAGVDEVYRIGGAQAVAALAFGTETIAAGRQDRRAGQRLCRRRQAPRVRHGRHRHDRGPVRGADHRRPRRQSGLDRRRPAGAGRARRRRAGDPDHRRRGARRRGRTRRRGATRDAAAQRRGRRVVARLRRDHPRARSRAAIPLVDAIAPEHLEIETADAERLADRIRNAGAIFLGAHTPEAIGDYVAGSNHVLPTARSARFSSGLGVLDFMKRTSILKCGPDALAALAPAAIALGEAEGLDAHARSVAIRLNR